MAVAAGCADCTITISSADEEGCLPALQVLRDHAGSVTSVCTLPGARLASASFDKTVKVWAQELEGSDSYSCVATLAGHQGAVECVCAVGGDGSSSRWWLASGSDDASVRLWDLARPEISVVLTGHTGPVMAVAPLANSRLASGSGDGTVKIWSLLRCLPLGSSRQQRKRPRRPPPPGQWSLVSTLAAVGSAAETAAAVLSLCPLVVAATGGLKKSLLVAGCSDGRLVLWDLSVSKKDKTSFSGQVLADHHADLVYSVCPLGRDGRSFASASYDGTVKVWNLCAGADDPSRPSTGQEHKYRCTQTLPLNSPVLSLCRLTDGRLVAGSSSFTMKVFA